MTFELKCRKENNCIWWKKVRGTPISINSRRFFLNYITKLFIFLRNHITTKRSLRQPLGTPTTACNAFRFLATYRTRHRGRTRESFWKETSFSHPTSSANTSPTANERCCLWNVWLRKGFTRIGVGVTRWKWDLNWDSRISDVVMIMRTLVHSLSSLCSTFLYVIFKSF